MGSKAERSKPVIAITEDGSCLTLLGPPLQTPQRETAR